ncbi:MAG TPA: type IV secretion system DNA-binding domain-containing protein [Steroidobacteraceae bacterium]|nr:type IV secretion system DNA-binding domain-containing protein [Steroidobacteraceae bacterium]
MYACGGLSAACAAALGSGSVSLLAGALVVGALGAALAGVARDRRAQVRHQRGALVRRGPPPVWPLRGAGRRARALALAAVPITLADETRHFKLIGTTGTGKSTAIRQLLGAALRRGDRAVVSDPDGAYLQRFAQRYRADAILNPFEPGSACWDPFAELCSDFDVDQLAGALIAEGPEGAAREWRGYARTLLCALLRCCRRRGTPCLSELWRLLTAAATQELRLVVRDTPAQTFLEPENARMFGSIRSVACSALAGLEYVRAQRAAPFSVRAWVRSGRGALFIPYRAGQIAALRTLIAAWLRLAIFEALDGAEGVDQRLWFIVDELDALGAIDGLKDALARLRKYGGRCVLALQSIAQVSGAYGPEAQTIVENCGNTLILRCSGSENGGTSQFAARLIGEREVIRRQRSHGRERHGLAGGPALRRSMQVSEQRLVESAVLASELEQLPDLAGYLKTASSNCWRRVRLVPT